MDALSRAEARVDPSTGVFARITWTELREIITSGELGRLTRTPQDLRAYEAWKRGIEAGEYGSVTTYMLEERLKWSLSSEQSDKQHKLLVNDFPYAFESGIQHLVFWTKTSLPDNLEALLHHLFPRIDRSDIQYFINPPALKSIGTLEHFHILLRNHGWIME